jgi:hypothetical protein
MLGLQAFYLLHLALPLPCVVPRLHLFQPFIVLEVSQTLAVEDHTVPVPEAVPLAEFEQAQLSHFVEKLAHFAERAGDLSAWILTILSCSVELSEKSI